MRHTQEKESAIWRERREGYSAWLKRGRLESLLAVMRSGLRHTRKPDEMQSVTGGDMVICERAAVSISTVRAEWLQVDSGGQGVMAGRAAWGR